MFATARKLEAIEDLAQHGCRLLPLDVCDEESMQRAVTAVEGAEGAVGVLVNNAGYGLEGAVEELALDEVRREFETNLFGAVRLTQLVLPGMRRQRWGKIVNVSSVGGRITLPGGAAYHASKHALEAVSDALRFEVRGFGVDVIVIEPGAIKTPWFDKAVGAIETTSHPPGPYAALDEAVAKRLRSASEGLLARFSGEPEQVARAIERVLVARRPRTRVVEPAPARLFIAMRRVLPDRAWDVFQRLLYPSPGRGPSR